MAHDEIKFHYSLTGCGWARIVFWIAGKKFKYRASYLCCPLDRIFDIAADVLDIPPKEDFNKHIFTIDEEWRRINIVLLFEAGQNRNVNLKIIENIDDIHENEKIVYDGDIDYYQFIQQAIRSATKILKKYGLIGYSRAWDYPFPLTAYLQTLDVFEDYHALWTEDFFSKTNIHEEIKLLCKALGPDYQKKDIYYYMYKGNLLELENHISEHIDEIDKLDASRYPSTPLIWAIKAGMESCAFILIRYGANINFRNKQSTALHFAVHAHSYCICKKLIEMNKDLINTPDDWGRIPIFGNIPYIKNQPENSTDYQIFDLFLQNDADLFYRALNGVTPMDLIEANEKHYKNNLTEYIKKNYPQIKIQNT